MTEPTDVDNDPAVTSRRHFLREGGALMGGVVLAGGGVGRDAMADAVNADNLPPNVPEWMKAPGDPMGSQLYGAPSPFKKLAARKFRKTIPNISPPPAGP